MNHPQTDAQIAKFSRRVNELRQALVLRQPQDLAAQAGAVFEPSGPGRGALYFSLWGAEQGTPVVLSFPMLVACDQRSGQELPQMFQALCLYYFYLADGSPAAGRWVSFADLQDGRFYNQAFQGYTGSELARFFGADQGRFEAAARRLGGVPAGLGDSSFVFRALPRLDLAVVYWQGDEDFPASCQVLFDAAANHYLPSDGCAILGSMLTRRLLETRRTSPG